MKIILTAAALLLLPTQLKAAGICSAVGSGYSQMSKDGETYIQVAKVYNCKSPNTANVTLTQKGPNRQIIIQIVLKTAPAKVTFNSDGHTVTFSGAGKCGNTSTNIEGTATPMSVTMTCNGASYGGPLVSGGITFTDH